MYKAFLGSDTEVAKFLNLGTLLLLNFYSRLYLSFWCFSHLLKNLNYMLFVAFCVTKCAVLH